MNGLYFYSPCVGFLFNKKKMSDYYGEYLFSSLYVAFPISKYQKLSDEFMFSSPHGAYLISIIKHLTAIIKPLKVFVPSRGISNLNADKVIVNFYEFVFVPSRGISNLNPVFYIALESRLPNMVCGGNRKPCTTSLYNHLLLSAILYFQGIGAK